MKISPVDMDKRAKLGIRAGDTVDVIQKIKEKDKFRLQSFEGLVLAHKHGNEAGATFTVRRVASGVGVEKIFPLFSPMIDDIKILKRAKVRRAKLYHIREKAAKEISRQMRNIRKSKDESEVENQSEVSSEASI
jgi:large subunit ribosomal protein L19